MKKIAIIFSFILIVVFSTGSYFIHQGYLSCYKKEFMAYISSHNHYINSKAISINSNELFTNTKLITWEDDYKELVYKGILYDLISIEKLDGKTNLIIVPDYEEENIKKQFASNYEDTSGHSTTNKSEAV